MQIKNIEASLNYGRYFTGKWLAFFIFSLIISLIIPVITIIIMILIKMGEMIFNNNMIWGLVLGNLFSIFLFIILNIVLLKNKKFKKQILLWLKDVIEIKAWINQIDTFYALPFLIPLIKIEVNFKLDGKNYSLISQCGRKRTKGYNNIFKKYCGKQVKVLYSPKYNEILFLKTDY